MSEFEKYKIVHNFIMGRKMQLVLVRVDSQADEEPVEVTVSIPESVQAMRKGRPNPGIVLSDGRSVKLPEEDQRFFDAMQDDDESF